MKFMHISDLHLGKRVNEFSMLEDQKDILRKILKIADEEKPQALLIAGDVYDKSIPTVEAIQLFDDFLCELSKRKVQTFIISGNHDSAERMAFGGRLMKESGVYVAPVYAGKTQAVVLEDEWGPINIYLLPFVKPANVKRFFEDEKIENYTDAIRVAVEQMKLNTDERNVLVTHQFVTGAKRSESEDISVGGTDNVDASVFDEFDYVALGHLHGEQNVGMSHIRYCGTLLKYSVSESSHHKSLSVVTLKEKGTSPQIELLPLHPLRDVQKKRGQLEEILKQAEEKEKDDYISITLTDEVEPYKPKEQLEKVFSHILEVRVDNTRTRNKLQELDEELTIKDPLESFADFYQEMQGKEMGEEEQEIMMQILEEAKGEKQ